MKIANGNLVKFEITSNFDPFIFKYTKVVLMLKKIYDVKFTFHS